MESKTEQEQKITPYLFSETWTRLAHGNRRDQVFTFSLEKILRLFQYFCD